MAGDYKITDSGMLGPIKSGTVCVSSNCKGYKSTEGIDKANA